MCAALCAEAQTSDASDSVNDDDMLSVRLDYIHMLFYFNKFIIHLFYIIFEWQEASLFTHIIMPYGVCGMCVSFSMKLYTLTIGLKLVGECASCRGCVCIVYAW